MNSILIFSVMLLWSYTNHAMLNTRFRRNTVWARRGDPVSRWPAGSSTIRQVNLRSTPQRSSLPILSTIGAWYAMFLRVGARGQSVLDITFGERRKCGEHPVWARRGSRYLGDQQDPARSVRWISGTHLKDHPCRSSARSELVRDVPHVGARGQFSLDIRASPASTPRPVQYLGDQQDRESHQSQPLYEPNSDRKNTQFLEEFYFDFFCYDPLKLHESCHAQYCIFLPSWDLDEIGWSAQLWRLIYKIIS